MSVDSILDRYLENPNDPAAVNAARQPEIFRIFARRCADLVESDPARSFPMLDRAVRIATSSCDVVQTIGFRAFASVSLDALTDARRQRDTAALVAADCPGCRAFLSRLQALILASSGSTRALSAADTTIQLYRQLPQGFDHDLHGNGPATAYHTRGDVRQHLWITYGHREGNLIQGAIEDFTTALDLTSPDISPDLYRMCLSGLAYVLLFTDRPEDLKRAYGYLCQARARMSGPRKATQERAKLAWVTAMVNRRIIDARIERPSQGMRPAKILKMLRRALDDVIRLGLPQESGAIAADIFRCFYPDADEVGKLAEEVEDRLDSRLSMPDVSERSSLYPPVRGALEAVRDFCRRKDAWKRPGRLREVIEGLRKSAGAGPNVVTCLIPWPPVRTA